MLWQRLLCDWQVILCESVQCKTLGSRNSDQTLKLGSANQIWIKTLLSTALPMSRLTYLWSILLYAFSCDMRQTTVSDLTDHQFFWSQNPAQPNSEYVTQQFHAFVQIWSFLAPQKQDGNVHNAKFEVSKQLSTNPHLNLLPSIRNKLWWLWNRQKMWEAKSCSD